MKKVYGLREDIVCSVYCGPFKKKKKKNLSTASGLSTPPTTPTQSASQPAFIQEAQPSTPIAEHPEATLRSRSLSMPPDTGQHPSLPSSKPPIPSSSPVPSFSTSQQVSLKCKNVSNVLKAFKVELPQLFGY